MQLKVALAQYLNGGEPASIVAAAADIVVFPEMYSNGYALFDPDEPTAKERWCADAHSLDGDFVGKFREGASRIASAGRFSGRPRAARARGIIDR